MLNEEIKFAKNLIGTVQLHLNLFVVFMIIEGLNVVSSFLKFCKTSAMNFIFGVFLFIAPVTIRDRARMPISGIMTASTGLRLGQ